jgi:hypothetical protein
LYSVEPLDIGQANFISQWHPTFRSPYQGLNSLSPERGRPTRPDAAYGRRGEPCEGVSPTSGNRRAGIGEALGVAGFTNLDVVRNPTWARLLTAQLMWHQIIPSEARRRAERTPLYSRNSRTAPRNSLRKNEPLWISSM